MCARFERVVHAGCDLDARRHHTRQTFVHTVVYPRVGARETLDVVHRVDANRRHLSTLVLADYVRSLVDLVLFVVVVRRAQFDQIGAYGRRV